MAVVTTNAATITALNAKQRAAVTDHGGRVRSISATVELANGDSIGSTYRLARVPSHARVKSIWLQCDAITSGAADIGLYRTAADGGAVVDADAYASAQSLASAIKTSPIDVAWEARDIAAALNRVWQDAGLTADSKTEYDITATLTADTAAAGTLTLHVEYVVD